MIERDGLIYVTDAEIASARSPAGGWTRQQLAQWRVAWPPEKGWRTKLQNGRKPDAGTEKLPPLSKRMRDCTPMTNSEKRTPAS